MTDTNEPSGDSIDITLLQHKLRAFAREREWEKFHSPKNLSMAIAVEAAELLQEFQWLEQRESEQLAPEKLEAVAYEMADILLYLLRMADRLDIDLLHVAEEKMAINAARYPAEKVRGSARKYTEYK